MTRLGVVVSVLGVLAVAGLLAVTGLGRTVRAPPAPLAAMVAFLPYLYAAVAATLFAAWVVVPDRRAVPGALAVLVVAAAVLWGPAHAPAVGAEGVPVRVASWNLRRLWGGPDDGGDALGCAVRAIEAADPDVLALLEVSADDVAALSSRLGLSCAHHPYRAGGRAKHGGLAACTRGRDWTLRSGEGQRFVDDEDWFYVLAEVEGAGRVVNVLAVHLSPYEYVAKKLLTGVDHLAQGDPGDLVELGRHGEEVVRGQADQSAALLARVERLRDPTVLAGDFNSTRDAFLHTALRRHLADAWETAGRGSGGTVTLFGMPLRIDYVYASRELAVVRTEVPEAGCSDHRPVVTELVLAD